MVKLLVGTLGLQKLFNSALPLRKQIGCPIRFTSLNAQVNFMSGEMGILAKFSQPYFTEFESDDEIFIVHRQLIEGLKLSFRNDYNVKFWTDSQYAHIQGEESGGHFTCSLMPVEEGMKDLPFQPTITETGLMPTHQGKILEFNIQARLTVEQLIKNLPKGGKNDKAGLSWDGKTLELSILQGSAVLQKNLNPKSFPIQGEPIAVYFDRRIFQDLAKQFVGEVWLGIGKGFMVISRAEYEYSLTYLLKAERVDDEL